MNTRDQKNTDIKDIIVYAESKTAGSKGYWFLTVLLASLLSVGALIGGIALLSALGVNPGSPGYLRSVLLVIIPAGLFMLFYFLIRGFFYISRYYTITKDTISVVQKPLSPLGFLKGYEKTVPWENIYSWYEQVGRNSVLGHGFIIASEEEIFTIPFFMGGYRLKDTPLSYADFKIFFNKLAVYNRELRDKKLLADLPEEYLEGARYLGYEEREEIKYISNYTAFDHDYIQGMDEVPEGYFFKKFADLDEVSDLAVKLNDSKSIKPAYIYFNPKEALDGTAPVLALPLGNSLALIPHVLPLVKNLVVVTEKGDFGFLFDGMDLYLDDKNSEKCCYLAFWPVNL